MPELKEDAATSLMNGVGDEFPSGHLLLRPDAGGIGIADSHGRDGGGLGENEAGAGPLAVVFRHESIWDALLTGTGASERSEEDAVRKRQGAELKWIE